MLVSIALTFFKYRNTKLVCTKHMNIVRYLAATMKRISSSYVYLSRRNISTAGALSKAQQKVRYTSLLAVIIIFHAWVSIYIGICQCNRNTKVISERRQLDKGTKSYLIWLVCVKPPQRLTSGTSSAWMRATLALKVQCIRAPLYILFYF